MKDRRIVVVKETATKKESMMKETTDLTSLWGASLVPRGGLGGRGEGTREGKQAAGTACWRGRAAIGT